jgi:hypothetical protein
VSEHFTNGTDIKAGYNQTSIVLSCIECHELDEMLVPGRNDPDNGAGVTYTYTNCSYCHQDVDTAFTVAMNDSAGHASMSNHTNDSLGPYCTDCHIVFDGVNATIRLHDQQLVKPSRSYTTALDGDGMLNSTFCMTCHNQKEVHAESELTGELDSDTLECAACHANVSNYTTGFGEKQIHGIRYINDSGVFRAARFRRSGSTQPIASPSQRFRNPSTTAKA